MNTANRRCEAFNSFLSWQLDRLYPAIAEDRHYMGENLHRSVGFQEAEKDFFEHGGYGCLRRWRTEYCARFCSSRANCSLAPKFIEAGD